MEKPYIMQGMQKASLSPSLIMKTGQRSWTLPEKDWSLILKKISSKSIHINNLQMTVCCLGGLKRIIPLSRPPFLHFKKV